MKTVEEVKQGSSPIADEIDCLSECVQRLSFLDKDAQGRVMRYLRDRLGIYMEGN